jgi:hypothetical protein
VEYFFPSSIRYLKNLYRSSEKRGRTAGSSSEERGSAKGRADERGRGEERFLKENVRSRMLPLIFPDDNSFFNEDHLPISHSCHVFE